MNTLFVTSVPYARKADNSAAFTEGTKLYAINGSTTALTLMNKALAIFTDRNELLVNGATGGILADVKYVRIALGRGWDSVNNCGYPPLISEPIYRDGTWSIKYETYGRPYKQVVSIGKESNAGVGALNLVSPLVPSGSDSMGYEATIQVERKDWLMLQGTAPMVRSYSIPITYAISAMLAADQAHAITAALVAAINADKNACVVATQAVNGGGKGIGINLTAKDYGYTFNVSAWGILEYATIVDSNYPSTTLGQAMVRGCGRPYMVEELETKYNAQRGKTDGMTSAQWNTWTETSQVSLADACGYELLTLEGRDFPTTQGELIKRSASKPNCKIAIEGALAGGVPSGAWTASDAGIKALLDTLIAAIFGAAMYVAATATEPATDVV